MARGRLTPVALALSALFGNGCSSATGVPQATGTAKADCEYSASAGRGHVLSVDVRCRGAAPTSFRAESGVSRYVSHASAPTGEPLAFEGDLVRLDPAARGLRYQVDLGRMARERRDFNHALRIGESIIAPGYSWMLTPREVPGNLPVSVQVSGSDPGYRFVSGLASDGGRYTLRANEIRVATFGIFGQFESDAVELEGLYGEVSRIDVVTLDGELAVGASVRRRWISETSRAVAEFFGGFPAPRAMLAVVPVQQRASVLHGKVLPESNPGVALLVGSQAGPEDLYADWILTHELFHLGFPSFVDEGKWLDEGLATYFEPLIRARKRWISEEDVWAEFSHNMPRGLAVLEHDGLENPSSHRGMYWAGATVSLMADVEAYQRSNGTRGLQHALRALLRAGGNASRVWNLGDAIAHIDKTLDAPILADLASRYTRGEKVFLKRLFAQLGVREQGRSVTLDDDAPLAHVRRAITRGAD